MLRFASPSAMRRWLPHSPPLPVNILTDTAAADVMGFGPTPWWRRSDVDVATIYVPDAGGELQLIGQSGSDRRLAAMTDLVATADTVVAECVRRGSAIVVDDWTVETAYPAPALIAAHGVSLRHLRPIAGVRRLRWGCHRRLDRAARLRQR